jgi:signal transduction histidine kinase
MDNATILLVDDQAENISVLYSLLHQYHYKILIAPSGEDALKVLEEAEPDLILLDVMMPGLSGFDVCRQLKSDPRYTQIPIIFITALTDTDYKLEGFAAGGVDYITKPFQQEEVLARVRTQLTIAIQHAELQQKNAELEQKNQELDAFAHTVAHDLKNPLNAILGYADLLQWKLADQNDPEANEAATGICHTATKISDIIEALLLLAGTSHHQTLYLDSCDMKYIINKVLERMKFELKKSEAVLDYPEKWIFIRGYPAWLEEVWANYISNALKYGGHPPTVELGFDESTTHVRFWVRDNGPGLTPAQQAQLFIPFTRLHKDRASGHGLGLSIVQRIMEQLGGSAGVESQPDEGCTFYFDLPKS